MEADKELLMRFAHPILVVMALGALAGCTSSATTNPRSADNMVHAEPRRISDGSILPDALRPGLHTTLRTQSF
jgi:hypothetical protein